MDSKGKTDLSATPLVFAIANLGPRAWKQENVIFGAALTCIHPTAQMLSNVYEKLLREFLEPMSKGVVMFAGSKQEPVLVTAEVIIVSADAPQMSAFAATAHQAGYHPCFRFVYDTFS